MTPEEAAKLAEWKARPCSARARELASALDRCEFNAEAWTRLALALLAEIGERP